MKVAVTEVSACRRAVAVELPPEVVEEEYDRTFRRFARKIRLDGFRAGKIPRHLVEQRFGREIEQEVVEHLIRSHQQSAIEGAGLRPLHAPILKDYKFRRGAGLSFVTEFEVRPAITASGYRGIKVRRRQVEVTEMDVLKALDELRERHARFEGVEGRGLEPGDFALADVSASPEGGDVRPFSHEDAFFEVGSAGPRPELTDEIRGMRPGEERVFGVRYPQDHPERPLAGRRVVYRVRLKEIKLKRLPDLDDDFAREMGRFETLEALRARARQDLHDAAVAREQDEARQQVLSQLVESHASVEVPDALVDDHVEGVVEDMMRVISARGLDPREAKVDWEELRREQRGPARRSVLAMLLLDAIAEQESIRVGESDLAAALDREAARRRQSAEALRARWEKDGRVDALKRQILREKVLDFLLAPANI
jgi:trigger factor